MDQMKKPMTPPLKSYITFITLLLSTASIEQHFVGASPISCNGPFTLPSLSDGIRIALSGDLSQGAIRSLKSSINETTLNSTFFSSSSPRQEEDGTDLFSSGISKFIPKGVAVDATSPLSLQAKRVMWIGYSYSSDDAMGLGLKFGNAGSEGGGPFWDTAALQREDRVVFSNFGLALALGNHPKAWTPVPVFAPKSELSWNAANTIFLQSFCSGAGGYLILAAGGRIFAEKDPRDVSSFGFGQEFNVSVSLQDSGLNLRLASGANDVALACSEIGVKFYIAETARGCIYSVVYGLQYEGYSGDNPKAKLLAGPASCRRTETSLRYYTEEEAAAVAASTEKNNYYDFGTIHNLVVVEEWPRGAMRNGQLGTGEELPAGSSLLLHQEARFDVEGVLLLPETREVRGGGNDGTGTSSVVTENVISLVSDAMKSRHLPAVWSVATDQWQYSWVATRFYGSGDGGDKYNIVSGVRDTCEVHLLEINKPVPLHPNPALFPDVLGSRILSSFKLFPSESNLSAPSPSCPPLLGGEFDRKRRNQTTPEVLTLTPLSPTTNQLEIVGDCLLGEESSVQQGGGQLFLGQEMLPSVSYDKAEDEVMEQVSGTNLSNSTAIEPSSASAGSTVIVIVVIVALLVVFTVISCVCYHKATKTKETDGRACTEVVAPPSSAIVRQASPERGHSAPPTPPTAVGASLSTRRASSSAASGGGGPVAPGGHGVIDLLPPIDPAGMSSINSSSKLHSYRSVTSGESRRGEEDREGLRMREIRLDPIGDQLERQKKRERHKRLLEVKKVYDFVHGGSYDKVKMIGRGSNGTVFSALLPDGKHIAVKQLPLKPDEGERALANIRREISIVRDMENPFVLQYYAATLDPKEMILSVFTELAAGGSLGELVRHLKSPLSDATAQQYVAKIVYGLAYIHERGVVHRDIKADNVLLTGDGGLKLADFGSSQTLVTSITRNSTREGLETIIGTPLFMAPEIFNDPKIGETLHETINNTNSNHKDILRKGTSSQRKEGGEEEEMVEDEEDSEKAQEMVEIEEAQQVIETLIQQKRGYGRRADIWSLGILVGELLDRGRPPWPTFHSPGRFFLHISDASSLPVVPAHLSPMAKDFIMTCCKRNPDDRPRALDLMRHPWIVEASSALLDQTTDGGGRRVGLTASRDSLAVSDNSGYFGNSRKEGGPGPAAAGSSTSTTHPAGPAAFSKSQLVNSQDRAQSPRTEATNSVIPVGTGQQQETATFRTTHQAHDNTSDHDKYFGQRVVESKIGFGDDSGIPFSGTTVDDVQLPKSSIFVVQGHRERVHPEEGAAAEISPMNRCENVEE